MDGSELDFTEQFPITRQKFRFHYMDSAQKLIGRWDSAPHHKELKTFPFHKHVPQGVEAHQAMTVIQVLDEIAKLQSVIPRD